MSNKTGQYNQINSVTKFIFEQQQKDYNDQIQVIHTYPVDSSSPHKLYPHRLKQHQNTQHTHNSGIQIPEDNDDQQNKKQHMQNKSTTVQQVMNTRCPTEIVTNIIKVKSLPKIKNLEESQHKISNDNYETAIQNVGVVKDIIMRNRSKNRNSSHRQYKSNEDQSNLECKSQSSSNKQTKPTKTIEEHQIQDGPQQIVAVNRIADNNVKKTMRSSESQADIKKINIIPRNAKRQLGQSDEEDHQQEYQSGDEDEQENYDHYQYDSYEPKMMSNKQGEIKMINSKIRHEVYKNNLPPVAVKLNHNKLQNFVKSPVRSGFVFETTIQIQSGFLGMGKKYHLKQKFQQNILMSAKKQFMSLTPNFIISLDKNNHSRRHRDFIGVMHSNFSGTSWSLQCPVLSSKFNEGQISNQLRIILTASYNSSLMGSKSIRDMSVQIIDPSLSKKQRESIDISNLKGSKKKQKIIKLFTAKPSLIKGKYQLDFKGLAKIPSSKNFILKNDKGQECLIFAKQNQQNYQMNVNYPLSLIEAFSLCLASIDGKLLVN